VEPLKYKETFLPDRYILVVETILTVIILGFFSTLIKLNALLSSIGQASIGDSLGAQADYFQRTAIDASVGGRLTAFVFWGLLGMAGYLFYWAVHNLVVNYHNERIIKATYVKPQHLDLVAFHRRVAAKILHYFSLAILPLLGFVSARTILTSALQLTLFGAANIGMPDGWLALIVAFLAVAASLHIIFVLNRLAFGKYTSI